MKLPRELYNDIEIMGISEWSDKWNPTLFDRWLDIETDKLQNYDDKKLVGIAIYCMQEGCSRFTKEIRTDVFVPMLQKEIKLLSRETLIDGIEYFYYHYLDRSDPDYIQRIVEVYMND